jgi:hypothetical protein
MTRIRRNSMRADSPRPGTIVGRSALIALPSAALGAMAAYFLDGDNGRRRRHVARDRARATLRRRARRLERQARFEAGKAVGLTHKAMRLGRPPQAPALDDVSLVRRVETQLFRDRNIPKGSISINADRGIVVLRGTIDSPTQIAAIEQCVRSIAGVQGVENLLHSPGTPAPPASPRGLKPPAVTSG